MVWFLLAILGGLSSSLFNYLNRYVLKTNNDSSSFAWWFEILRIIIFILILPIDYYFIFSYRNLAFLGVLGMTEFVSVYTFMKMHQLSELSVSSLIQRLKLVWIPIMAFILIGEKLKMQNYIGIFIVFLGLSFIVSPKKYKTDAGIRFAIISSVATAILSVFMKIASSFASVSIISIAMGIPFVVIFPFIGKSAGIRIKSFFTKDLRGVIMATFANVIAMYFLVAALKVGSVSLVTGVYQGMSITSVLAGIFILGETKDIGKKIFGSVILLIGMLLFL